MGTFLDVRNAVMETFQAVFPDMPVYGEEPEETLGSPYLYVRLPEGTHTQEMGRRFRRENSVAVRYKPSGSQPNGDMYAMAEQLAAVLHQISLSGRPLAGRDMRFEIAEDVLLFSVTYQFVAALQAPEDPAMQQLDHMEGIK
ncbi:MAG: hypothetical protein K0Q90_350 [Paenibacillaceae bacterium]|jgi:hypothetical protein|nr:hypothetical protein [Paenibacillaceae bacterium]